MRDVHSLRKARGEKIDALEALNVEAGEKSFTDEQSKAYAALKDEVKALDEQIARAEELKALKASQATPVAEVEFKEEEKAAPRQFASVAAPREKGTDFARIVRSLAANNGIPRLAAEFAEATWGVEGKDIAKALGSSTGSAGGFLVPENYSAEIIELLRNRAVIRAAGATTMPMNGGSLIVPKLASGATGTYIGENTNASAAQPSFGQLRLTARTLAAVVPISNQFIRFSSPQADAVVRDDLVAGIAVTEDATFLRGDGVGASPKGIRYWANSANIVASAGTTAANIETDLKAAINALEGNNVRMIRPVWIMSPRTKNALYTLRNTQGALIFPEIREGNLWGYPVFVSNNVPTNLGSGSDSELYFVDMADAVIGEEMGVTISVSDTAAYYDGSAVQAAFSQDQTVVRALVRHDFGLRHDYSAAVITGLGY